MRLTSDSSHLCENTLQWMHEEFRDGVDEAVLVREAAVHAYGTESHAGFYPIIYRSGLVRYAGRMMTELGWESCARALASLESDHPHVRAVVDAARAQDRVAISKFMGGWSEGVLARRVAEYAAKVIELRGAEERPDGWVALIAAIRGES